MYFVKSKCSVYLWSGLVLVKLLDILFSVLIYKCHTKCNFQHFKWTFSIWHSLQKCLQHIVRYITIIYSHDEFCCVHNLYNQLANTTSWYSTFYIVYGLVVTWDYQQYIQYLYYHKAWLSICHYLHKMSHKWSVRSHYKITF